MMASREPEHCRHLKLYRAKIKPFRNSAGLKLPGTFPAEAQRKTNHLGSKF